jgi:hypothetical protein
MGAKFQCYTIVLAAGPVSLQPQMQPTRTKGVSKANVEKVLDGLTALGMLAGYESGDVRQWKLPRATA